MNKDIEKKNNEDLLEKVYHTDARVTAMEGQLSSITQAMSRIEAHILNKPPVNIYGIVALTGSVLFCIAQYTHLTLDPIETTVQNRGEVISTFRDFKEQTHYEFGMLHENKEYVIKELDRSYKKIEKLEEDVQELTAQVHSNQQKVDSNERSVEKIDTFGSRKWIKSQDTYPR